MLYTAKQYVDHTTNSVRQLRELNAELTATNQRLVEEIQQRAAAETEAARLTEEAARAAALEELSQLKSRFVSIASHELRTPLTTLAGYTELVLADTPPDDPRHAMLERAYQSAGQLAKLIDDLLDVSRIETGRMTVEPAAVDLAAVIPTHAESLAGGAPRHRLVVAVAPDARWVEADPERIQQILTNLIGNAIKYSPGGGQVSVTTARGDRPGYVEISVADEGLGIPADQIDSIFDPYQRVRSPATRRIRGTGLGLYIVRHLVELQDGSVRVESEVGRGSTFIVSLPVAADTPTT
jgi:signal transduction histidine kinase